MIGYTYNESSENTLFLVTTYADDKYTMLHVLYDKHYKRMLYTAGKMLRPEQADDAVHDVFLKLIERYGEDGIAAFADKPNVYFTVMTRNHALNVLRKKKPDIAYIDWYDEDGDDIFTEHTDDPLQTVIDYDAYDALTAMICRLKPAFREILEYKYIMEYTNAEIAEMLNISQTSVTTRINRAKNSLRELLESEKGVKNAEK